MFIDEDELTARLVTDQNLVNQIQRRSGKSVQTPISQDEPIEPRPLYEIDRCGSGRTPGSFNRNPLEREAIGTLGHMHGITQAAKETGASPSQVHSYMGGYNTTGRRAHDASLENAVKKNVGKIRDAAIERMLSSMNMITDEKLGQIKKAETLANIAATLGKVAQIGLPKDSGPGHNTNQVQIVVYAP